jgi:fructokinase
VTVYGGIETGGTKWSCAIGSGPDDLRATETFPTTTPDETIARAVSFFEQNERVDAIGIGSFGPVDLHPGSPTWGHITTTPKPGWSNTDVAGEIGRRLDVPVAFDTDVNAAALGEHRWGAAQGLDTFAYVTVGTGIGGGAMVGGRLVHGLLHPEFGHLRVPHDREADPFDGVCPYHGDCWEGLASAPALAARWRRAAHEIEDERAWELEARYLALGLVSVIAVLSPERIVIGGGVMQHDGLHAQVHREVVALVNGYLAASPEIVPPALGTGAGVFGAIALAEDARKTSAMRPDARAKSRAPA